MTMHFDPEEQEVIAVALGWLHMSMVNPQSRLEFLDDIRATDLHNRLMDMVQRFVSESPVANKVLKPHEYYDA